MRGAARRAMRCHRGRAATKQMAPNPLRPNGLPRHGPACRVVAPRRCAKASTASRRLASGAVALATRPTGVFQQPASRLLRNSHGPRARGLGAICEARRGWRCGAIVDEPQQSRWPPTPCAQMGCRGTAPPAVLSLLGDALRHRRRRDALHPGPWRWQRDLREFFSSLLDGKTALTIAKGGKSRETVQLLQKALKS